ncbi:DEAD/DEAH box helicase [Paraphaeosphaeria minitans]|uniref:DEAD/DEAH box helicase n=1 Tax=Paraphaeosphaeria minitans TaxID=565426 RepID=A0A9P6KST9_9PLEO|nr:DEAD/DEAH box helicase [Paraphaeosphaeria minitans]
MANEDSDSSSKSQHAVLEWYARIYSRRVDIVGDYSGNELFLVDGDSLLLHCFGDDHLDFESGFQLLHATWTVENFLRNLISRRANFHVVFFDQHRDLCVPSVAPAASHAKYLLAREAIIRHLAVNLKATHPEVLITVFPSITSDDFVEYLKTTEFYFILCHDGASSKALRKRNLIDKTLDPLEDEDHDEDEELRKKVIFRQLIHWSMAQGSSIVLINGLEFQDARIIATVLENLRGTGSGLSQEIDLDEDDAIDEPRQRYLERSTWESVTGKVKVQLTERHYLTVIVLSALLAGNKVTKDFVSSFLRHTALISGLSLQERLVSAAGLDEKVKESLEVFCEEASTILASEDWADNMEAWNCRCDVADLVDGRLLSACLQDAAIGVNDVYRTLTQACEALGAGISSNDIAASNGTATATSHTPQSTSSESYAVLPFSNEIFDPHLAPVQLEIDRVGDLEDATTANIFREISHWHNHKRPLDPKLREEQLAKSEKQKFWTRKRNQWFMDEMQKYAQSLTNTVGKSLDPETITTGGRPVKPIAEVEENAKPKQKPAAKSNKKAAPSRKEAMLAKIAADRSAKEETTAEKHIQGWRTTVGTIEKEPTATGRYQRARTYLATLNTGTSAELKRDTLEGEVRLYMLNALLDPWLVACKNDEKPEAMKIAALIFAELGAFSKFNRPVTSTIIKCLQAVFKELALPQLPLPQPEGDRPLAFKFALESTTRSLALPIPQKEFQLLHCGPYFDRSIDSAPDPRVPFEPDAWQRKVLNEIDAKRSLLVVAPTSAGKTFISFYAMKQVLEANDEDVLVYVAPTKALVNQIAAEIQGRFSKRYGYAGNSVWAIHTRDMRINNPTGCQILVTVPHILQIMLLSPPNANSWSKRIKWIIFDEVHCIGQAEDGLIWEQLLLMAPCPILALSATIGNPDEFSAWLDSTQRSAGNKLTMVQHPHRYSDLRKFIYKPSDIDTHKFTGLEENRAFAQLGLDDSKDFHFVHPVSTLVNRSRGIPADLALEARDCYLLWQTLSRRQTASHPLDKSLDPAVALPSVIRKIDTIKWEAALKSVLRDWMQDPESPFDAVVKDLGGNQEETISESPPKEDGEATPAEDADASEENEVEIQHDIKSILPMLSKLHEQDALPAILFNYDRGLCERICRKLMEQLVDAETVWKESSAQWKGTLAKWEEWKKIMLKAGKRGPPKLSKKKGGAEEGLTKEDIQRDAANNEASPWASFNPDKPIDKFHFADNRKMSQDEMDKTERELLRRDVPEWLITALKRGIAVHHAGLNRKYRQVCEILFRRGFLRVVIATGTLALGINMPCKTVVFTGDSVFLSALNFRQAAGRAGRRGFDMLGNVVFHSISTSRVHRLISSRLPDINGHFPITTTLVLRLFTLLNDSKQSQFASRSVNALLSQPRLYLGGEESKMTVLHHLRFSIEYLRRQFLLDARGAPLNFAGCVSHLYFTENSSFAFHALLKDGYFHKVCANLNANDTAKENVLRELMLTMAHLFGRQYCRQADQEFVEKVVKRSPSVVFLPDMPTDAAELLRKHNQSTLDIYKAYVGTFVDQHLKEQDDALPLTQFKAGSVGTASADGLKLRAPTKVRSPFVALSGHEDTFQSVHDLCTTTRSGVFLEEAVIPYVGLYPEESELPLNAYLYDFFNHGDVNAIVIANRIRRGDVWFVLNDFSMVLATIVTSLSNFMQLTAASDLDLSDVRGEGEDAEALQDDKFLPDDSGYETASTMSTATRTGPAQTELPVQVKKKKKVVDSWDDDADQEDLEEEVAAQRAKKEAEVAAKNAQDRPAWEEGAGLLNVLKAFQALKEDFDTKFRAMWA